MHNMKRAIAESYFALGDIAKGEEYPKIIWGYTGWGDMYLWPMKKSIKPDYEKAEKIYKMPLVMDLEGKADLIDRLYELKTEREKNI